jgi:hypothetical protein
MFRRVKIAGAKLAGVAAWLLVLLSITLGVTPASAQQCPVGTSSGLGTPSQTRILNGRLIYHDGIRQWFELRLDRPTCGEHSIQLVMTDRNYASLEVLRTCRIASSGSIDYSPTGYYSANLYQHVSEVRSVGGCTKQRHSARSRRLGRIPTCALTQWKCMLIIDPAIIR